MQSEEYVRKGKWMRVVGKFGRGLVEGRLDARCMDRSFMHLLVSEVCFVLGLRSGWMWKLELNGFGKLKLQGGVECHMSIHKILAEWITYVHLVHSENLLTTV